MLAVVLFHNYTDWDVEMSIASIDPKWALNRTFIKACFTYAFDVLGVDRITGRAETSNDRAIRMDKRLGFKQEGICRRALAGQDIIIFGMLREECRFLNG